eukprot:gnl/TRDRNA2_/TRDRNA2_96299_c0_seq1.p1 gnl/TRDRNA2_/TRDRNA2_96299_c0~~gnl/TRDRNA2_/TRDRNA2_96299_c0_seq1.p1  ORF type:complete len:111 (+),score=8.62 gnl/TRDRNA2_/TRDRNA2_96299_c0_seq1:815-1147(+)
MLVDDSLLDRIDMKHERHRAVQYYQLLMDCLTATGQLPACFALLRRVENSGLLTLSDDDSYPMFRTLLELCRSVGDSSAIWKVQAALQRLGLIGSHPRATMHIDALQQKH